MSPDAWYFKGPHYEAAAKATVDILNSKLLGRPEMHGRYAVANLTEPAEDPFCVISVAGLASQPPLKKLNGIRTS